MAGVQGSQQAQIAEGDGVHQHPNAPTADQALAQIPHYGVPALVRESVEIEGDEITGTGPDLIESRFDPLHCTATVSVDDGDGHAVSGHLLGRGQAETAGAAQDQGPLLAVETDAHRRPLSRLKRGDPPP